MIIPIHQNKRVVLVHWKNKPENPFEVYSSLKIFCDSYKEYNYNTISNYLSKRKIAFDNDKVRIERKSVISKPGADLSIHRITPVVRKLSLEDAGNSSRDLNYWLGKSPVERVAAVTHIISQSLTKGQRIDKQKIVKRKLSA